MIIQEEKHLRHEDFAGISWPRERGWEVKEFLGPELKELAKKCFYHKKTKLRRLSTF